MPILLLIYLIKLEILCCVYVIYQQVKGYMNEHLSSTLF